MSRRARHTYRFAATRRCGVLLLFGLCNLWVFNAVCGCRRSADETLAPAVSPTCPLRPVRVLIREDPDRIRVHAKGGIEVLAADGDTANGETLGTVAQSDWVTVSVGDAGGIQIGDRAHAQHELILAPVEADAMWVALPTSDGWSPPREYLGRIRVYRNPSGALEVVNLVGVEQYVACVVPGEVWPTFDVEAFRAQAIVARGYVLYQMRRRARARYDLTAGEGSQVYRGLRLDQAGIRGWEAAGYTRGVVCTWSDGGDDRLFSTYFSSVCGGVTQSAAINSRADDIPPLRGGVRCDYCKNAPGDTYRWAPVRLATRKVLQRLQARYPQMAEMDAVVGIDVTQKTEHGRALRVRVVAGNGKSRELTAERFRLAIGARSVKSTWFDIRVAGGEVIIDHGRGFGHGMGLCQWGTQGQAVAHKRAGEILAFYYPGSKLTRVY